MVSSSLVECSASIEGAVQKADDLMTHQRYDEFVSTRASIIERLLVRLPIHVFDFDFIVDS